MSAPLIWIVFPGVIAVLLAFFSRWQRIGTAAAFATAALLFALGVALPLGRELSLGPLAITISETLTVFGREAVITPADISEVLIIYWGGALWIGGSYFARTPRFFPAIALGMAALQVAAITIQPFLYAAVFIELLAVMSVPLIVEPGKEVRNGVLRMIVLYTLGMAAILFVGWMLTAGGSAAAGDGLFFSATMLLMIGFVFFLAVFPAHSWAPMIMRRGNPYSSAFIIFWLIQAALLFGNGLFTQFNLIGDNELGLQVLNVVSVLIVLIFGLLLVFEENLGSFLGLTIQLEVGFSLLAIGIQATSGDPLFYALLFAKTLPIILWALITAYIYQKEANLDFSVLQGKGSLHPWISSGLILSILGVVGLPLLPIFPLKVLLMQSVSFGSGWLYIGIILGSGGVIVAVIRIISGLFAPVFPDRDQALTENDTDKPKQETQTLASSWVEDRQMRIVITVGILLLFLSAMFSGFILPIFI